MTRKEREKRAAAARKGWRTRRRHERALELELARKAEERAARRRAREREKERQAAARKEAAKKGAATRKRNARKAEREQKKAEEEKAKIATKLEREQRKREREIEEEQLNRADRKAKGELPETWKSGTREEATAAEEALAQGSKQIAKRNPRGAPRMESEERSDPRSAHDGHMGKARPQNRARAPASSSRP